MSCTWTFVGKTWPLIEILPLSGQAKTRRWQRKWHTQMATSLIGRPTGCPCRGRRALVRGKNTLIFSRERRPLLTPCAVESVPFTGTTPYDHSLYGLKQPSSQAPKEKPSVISAPRPLLPQEGELSRQSHSWLLHDLFANIQNGVK